MADAQKKAETQGYTIVLADASGFALLPSVVRTYAPCACTPIMAEGNLHEHLSAIGGLTRNGEFYMRVYETALTGREAAAFLRHLLQHMPGKVMVIWDRAQIHRSREVKDLLASDAGQRLWLEALPTAAPELNPTEGVWHLLKDELKNLACVDLAELRHELHLAYRRVRTQPDLLTACFAQAGLRV
ncbi:MAG: transposase [Chloroflexi bacterium]|nr:transposase [Chloroflexota bacterium]